MENMERGARMYFDNVCTSQWIFMKFSGYLLAGCRERIAKEL
jgi:hypothetical protein